MQNYIRILIHNDSVILIIKTDSFFFLFQSDLLHSMKNKFTFITRIKNLQ